MPLLTVYESLDIWLAGVLQKTISWLIWEFCGREKKAEEVEEAMRLRAEFRRSAHPSKSIISSAAWHRTIFTWIVQAKFKEQTVFFTFQEMVLGYNPSTSWLVTYQRKKTIGVFNDYLQVWHRRGSGLSFYILPKTYYPK